MVALPLAKVSHDGDAASESFYSLSHEGMEGKACNGLACFVARHLKPDVWQKACSQQGKIYCLGKCYEGPAVHEDTALPLMAVHSRQSVLLERIIAGGVRKIREYCKHRGYKALETVRGRPPEATLAAIESSNLRGRGGAGFPTARKWRAVAQEKAAQKYVVANGDEGDPAAYIDRFLIEDDPHCLIEAMAIAAYAVGANKGYIYLRKEYPAAIDVLSAALAEAREAGYIGKQFDLVLFEGHGSYICGEETALLNSIEGKRAEVRVRPPYPTQEGLWGKPTLVNNIETFANIPWIINHGPDVFKAMGFSKSQGTKLVSLNSLFRKPGLYEVEFGVTLRYIVEELGGGLKTGAIKGLIVGGPLAGVLPGTPEYLETKFGFEEMRAVGAMVGHGGILAFDEHTSIRELIHHIAEFAALESCGKCTPCRRGGERLAEMFSGKTADKTECNDINTVLLATSLCGLGTGLGEFTTTALKHFGEELATCLK